MPFYLKKMVFGIVPARDPLWLVKARKPFGSMTNTELVAFGLGSDAVGVLVVNQKNQGV